MSWTRPRQIATFSGYCSSFSSLETATERLQSGLLLKKSNKNSLCKNIVVLFLTPSTRWTRCFESSRPIRSSIEINGTTPVPMQIINIWAAVWSGSLRTRVLRLILHVKSCSMGVVARNDVARPSLVVPKWSMNLWLVKHRWIWSP
jgi:hypothetical protein